MGRFFLWHIISFKGMGDCSPTPYPPREISWRRRKRRWKSTRQQREYEDDGSPACKRDQRSLKRMLELFPQLAIYAGLCPQQASSDQANQDGNDDDSESLHVIHMPFVALRRCGPGTSGPERTIRFASLTKIRFGRCDETSSSATIV